MKTLKVMTLLGCTVALVACGDSPDNAPDTGGQPAVDNRQVPASAAASIAAFFGYTGWLTANETAQPLGLDLVTPPTTETEVPSPVT
ncbi:MAG: hypothetical protein Q7U99_27610 [Rubrivivax sp.]|nr:hypothetical protein [Rubrivivax sp.]MDP3226305.1 hypothetical protein [Rubrivivax sp.]